MKENNISGNLFDIEILKRLFVLYVDYFDIKFINITTN